LPVDGNSMSMFCPPPFTYTENRSRLRVGRPGHLRVISFYVLVFLSRDLSGTCE